MEGEGRYYSSPASHPLSVLVVAKRAPVLVAPARETPRRVFSVPAERVAVDSATGAIGSTLSSHTLLCERQVAAPGHVDDYPRDAANEVLVHNLIAALQRTLVPYYPLAGRLMSRAAERYPYDQYDRGSYGYDHGKGGALGHDHAYEHYEGARGGGPLGRHDHAYDQYEGARGGGPLGRHDHAYDQYKSAKGGPLEVVCEGQGALFVEACCNLTLAQLKQLDRSYWSEFQTDLIHQLHSQDIPTLVAQVTMLACGSFVLGIRVLHSLCDTAGILHFFHAWSEYARGEREPIPIATPIWGDTLSGNVVGRGEWFHYPSLQLAQGAHQTKHQYDPYYDQGFHPLANISIPLNNLTYLKDSIAVHCNKFEVLAALLWRERTRALSLPPYTDVILFFPAPVAHDLPLLFYGQYPFNCMASMSTNDLLQQDLTYTIRAIQGAKQYAEESFALCATEFARVHALGERNSPPPHVLLFTLLYDIVYDIDFGWGSAPYALDAARVRSPVNVVAITGAVDDDLHFVMTNAPPQLLQDVQQFVPGAQFNTLPSGSRL